MHCCAVSFVLSHTCYFIGNFSIGNGRLTVQGFVICLTKYKKFLFYAVLFDESLLSGKCFVNSYRPVRVRNLY